MKKFILLLNQYLSNFWFILLLLTIGCLLVIFLDPMSLVIYFGRNNEFASISAILFSFGFCFLLPLAIISILLAVQIWLRNKAGNNYIGFSSLIITILTLGTLFFLDVQLVILDRNIRDGVFDIEVNNPAVINNHKTVEFQNNITPEAESPIEKWSNAPAEIKRVASDSTTYLTIDILSRNPDFVPGKTSFFNNQNTKLRDVFVNENTKAYICGKSSSGNATIANEQTDTAGVINFIKNLILMNEKPIYYFDIENNIVQTIYQQCLP